MSDWVVKLLVIGFATWVIWAIVNQRYVFEISVESGQPRIRRGKVTRAFLDRVAEVCQDCGVARGWIGGVLNGRRVSLRFSRHFPPGSQQRLRNEWQAAG